MIQVFCRSWDISIKFCEHVYDEWSTLTWISTLLATSVPTRSDVIKLFEDKQVTFQYSVKEQNSLLSTFKILKSIEKWYLDG